MRPIPLGPAANGSAVSPPAGSSLGLRPSPSALAALRRATELALDRQDPLVLPTHLLLGILADPGCTASTILAELEVGAATIGAHLCRLLPPLRRGRHHRPARRSAALRTALSAAAAEADTMGPEIGTGHLLLGLLQDPTSLAAMVLRGHGVSATGVRAAVHRHRRGQKTEERYPAMTYSPTPLPGKYHRRWRA